jgi:hypothetical protein
VRNDLGLANLTQDAEEWANKKRKKKKKLKKEKKRKKMIMMTLRFDSVPSRNEY